jgi:cyclopropane fatty-acyl-phospholipid synthase-like methyltransferase
VAAMNDLSSIRAYYDQTWLDYRVLWLNSENYAIHFGYWDETTHTNAQALNRLNAVLSKRLALRPDERVLDAGCGVGGSAIWIAKTIGAQVVGITPVQSQVDRATRFAREAAVERLVSFACEDYTQTPFEDGSFDVVWAVESVCHAADKAMFFREARRLLRPGGRLGMVEYMRTARPLVADEEALLHCWLSGWAIPDIGTAAEHRQWATDAGFTNIQLVDTSDRVRPSLHRLYRMAVLAGPGERLLQAMRLRSSVQHGNVRGARNQFRALERGLWFYAILTAEIPMVLQP